MPGGRPTKYTKELAEKLCGYLAVMPAYKACEKAGIDRNTLYNWGRRHEQFFRDSAQARAQFALRQLDEAEQLLKDGCEPKEVALLRERMQHYRWKASRLLRAMFSERQEISGPDGAPVGVMVAPASIAPKDWEAAATAHAQAIQQAVGNGATGDSE